MCTSIWMILTPGTAVAVACKPPFSAALKASVASCAAPAVSGLPLKPGVAPRLGRLGTRKLWPPRPIMVWTLPTMLEAAEIELAPMFAGVKPPGGGGDCKN